MKKIASATESTDYKIISYKSISEKVIQWREDGQSLVFSNGCFDLLHAGHVRYLQAASAFGDIFILGLNSDSSVRKLKGPSRPFMTQADRAFLLSAMEAIDCVVIFEEETPARLIDTVIPDVLVKGGDYTAKKIVGYETVTKNGGRVEIVPFLEGKSSSSIIKLIMEQG